MKARDFIPEQWFSDLDPNMLAVMGYGKDEQPEKEKATVDTVAQNARAVRRLSRK